MKNFCACAGGHRLECNGKCCDNHTDRKTGKVRCGECYTVHNYVAPHDESLSPDNDTKKKKKKKR